MSDSMPHSSLHAPLAGATPACAQPTGTSIPLRAKPALAATVDGRQPSTLVFVLVFLALLGLQLFYWTGPIASDDLVYLSVAQQPLGVTISGEYRQVGTVGMRFLVWGPLRLLSVVWPNHWQILFVLPMVSASLTLGLVAVATNYCLGRRAALIAMASLGLVPMFVIVATVTLPDIVATPFALAGAMLIGQPLLDRTKGHRSVFRRCFVGGFILALGYNAKEPTLLVLPAITLYVLWRQRHSGDSWRYILWAWCGAGVWLSVEAMWYAATVGDPLYHLHAISSGHRVYGSPLPDYRWTSIAWYLSDYLRYLIDPRREFGLMGPVFLLALAYGAFARTELTRMVLCIVFVVGGYLSAGTADLLQYVPIYHQPRYIVPLLPPMAMAVAYMIDREWSRGGLRRAAITAAACITIPMLLIAPDKVAGRWHHSSDFQTARSLLTQMEGKWAPGSRMVASSDTAMRLDLLMKQGEGRTFESIDESPVTEADWQSSYAGCYVWVVQADRVSRGDGYGTHLGMASYAALQSFPRVAIARSAMNRLASCLYSLGLGELTHRSYGDVELFRIPSAGEASLATSRDSHTLGGATGMQRQREHDEAGDRAVKTLEKAL